MQNIAYFSMEIGLHSDIRTYSGGLGILAGDSLKSAADLKLPMVGVSLLYREGHFRQNVETGNNGKNRKIGISKSIWTGWTKGSHSAWKDARSTSVLGN